MLVRIERLRAGSRLLGPAFVAAVAYVDPGNVATNTAAGAAYGYADMGPYSGGQAELLRVPWADWNALVLPEDAPMAPRADGFDNPLVRTIHVPGAGHCVRRDRPEAFHAAVDAFLAEHLG